MLTQANPEAKVMELDALQAFSSNVIATCKEKHLSFAAVCREANIKPSRLYEMRLRKFDRFISLYTLVRLSVLVDVPIHVLFIPRPQGEASPQPVRRVKK